MQFRQITSANSANVAKNIAPKASSDLLTIAKVAKPTLEKSEKFSEEYSKRLAAISKPLAKAEPFQDNSFSRISIISNPYALAKSRCKVNTNSKGEAEKRRFWDEGRWWKYINDGLTLEEQQGRFIEMYFAPNRPLLRNDSRTKLHLSWLKEEQQLRRLASHLQDIGINADHWIEESCQ